MFVQRELAGHVSGLLHSSISASKKLTKIKGINLLPPVVPSAFPTQKCNLSFRRKKHFALIKYNCAKRDKDIIANREMRIYSRRRQFFMN